MGATLAAAAQRAPLADASRTTVKLGRSSVKNVEIRAGLKEGDQVILSDMAQWDHVDRIRLQ